MDRDKRLAAFIPVLGMPTHVIKFGTIKPDTDSLFLVIPGNPGVAEFYDQFMCHLYEENQGRVPVWAVSHAGHVTPEDGNKALYNKLSNQVCTLEGQINHKIQFIEENIPKHVKLFLIGHSIGCYIILKMLSQLKQDGHSVGRCFQLFPTIERMALSPNGKIYTPALKYFRWMAPLVLSILSLVPEGMKQWLIRKHFNDEDTPKCVYSATSGLVNAFAVGNSLFMANQEMQRVSNLDTELVQQHISCLSFYYGLTDGWCPKEYYSDMKDKFPNGDIRLCKAGHEHAFVVSSRSNKDLAGMIWLWAQPHL